MRKQIIESRVLQIVSLIQAGHRLEDSLVELKREWPDPKKAARRLAGHANAARGEPILWIIGLDQKEGVVGAGPQELANWCPQVWAEFDGITPSVLDLNVPIENAMLVALQFQTDRAPYVVKNPHRVSLTPDPLNLKSRGGKAREFGQLPEPNS